MIHVSFFFFFKQKTAYEMRISDWSSYVCSSDLPRSTTSSPASQGAKHMHALPPRNRMLASDAGWCLRVNRIGARSGVRRAFAIVSRLGDGVFWYVLMAVLVMFDGYAGLLASLHLAATGAVALLLYKAIKRWTRRPRPFAADVRIRAWIRSEEHTSELQSLMRISYAVLGL